MNLLDDNWDIPPRRQSVDFVVPWLGHAVVWGPAQTQGSKKGFVHPHTQRVVIVDDNDRALKGWRQELIDAMQRTKPVTAVDTSVAVSIIVYVPRPRTHYRTNGELKPNAARVPPAGRDIDKIARAIFDAMQIACWVTNDARVSDLHMRRRYDDGIGERTWIWAWQVSEPDQPMPTLDETIDISKEAEW
jgi:Holliday junction resolvase RusA-like endonuclease